MQESDCLHTRGSQPCCSDLRWLLGVLLLLLSPARVDMEAITTPITTAHGTLYFVWFQPSVATHPHPILPGCLRFFLELDTHSPRPAEFDILTVYHWTIMEPGKSRPGAGSQCDVCGFQCIPSKRFLPTPKLRRVT